MKNSTFQRKLSAGMGLLLLLLAILLSGCMETRYTIRDVDQHHGGHFNTVQTTGERLIMVGPFEYGRTPTGINYWNCRQYDSELVCERVCDDVWNQICRPGLRGRFGSISRPNSGVAVARYISRTSTHDESWDTGLATEERLHDESEPESDALPQEDAEHSDHDQEVSQ